MRRTLAMLLVFTMLFALAPQSAFAKAKQMNDGVPVWAEDTVRQYMLDYIEGLSMERLYGYFDLQIRRYMPNEAYESLLGDLEWMTGDFVGFGSYRSFSTPEEQLKTHVLHLCMEKQDLEVYFTHKDKEDDWEIMAIDFVPAEKEAVADNGLMLVGDTDTVIGYSVETVTIGSAEYPLEGLLTIPDKAKEQPVPVCILIHESGARDRYCAIGKTAIFADMTDALVDMNIATLCFDKRNYVYPEAPMDTVKEEVVDDALSAVNLVKNDPRFDPDRIVVIGVGFGAMVAPRIALEAEGAVTGLVLIGGTPDTLLELEFAIHESEVNAMPKDEANVIKNAVRKMAKMKEDDARQLTLFGRNGYYYWEMEKNTSFSKLKKTRMPIYIIQGEKDPVISEENGGDGYLNGPIGPHKGRYIYQSFHNLNHLLMNDLTVNANGQPEYAVEAHLDPYAALCIGQWVYELEPNKK